MLAIVSEDSEALWNESVSFSCLQCNVRGKKNLQWLLPSFFLLSWCAMWNAVQQCTQYYQTMYSLFTVNQAEITQGVTKPYLGRKIPKIRMTPQKSHDIAFWSPRPPASWMPSCRGTRWTQLYHCRLRRTCWSSPGEIYDGDVAVKKPEVHPQLDFLQASSWLLQARQCWCSRFRQCRTQGTPFIDKWEPWQSKYCLPISCDRSVL